MSSHAPDNSLISLQGVTMRHGSRIVLDDVSIDIRQGDFVAITGPNGGGKTTLLRIILGLLKPTQGTVRIDKAVRVGYLPQKNMIDSHFPISVAEVVESGLLSASGLSREQKRAKVEAVMEQVGLQQHARNSIGELSGGQLQRALLGRAIISDPQLLVLDEPLSYIDKRFERSLYGIIEQAARNATVLLVSHEMSVISGMANRHFIVDVKLHECSAAHHHVHYDCDD